MTRVEAFLSNESGVTAIEYALVIIFGVQFIGTNVSTMFIEVGNSLK